MLTRSVGQRGFGLVEILVGLTIFGIAMAAALPAFNDWMINSRIRASAESLQQGLYLARSEAARRNSLVRFQMVSSLASTCALSTTGAYWVVNMGTTSPANSCNSSLSDTTSPFLLAVSPTIRTNSTTAYTANRSALGFDGLGRLSTLGGTVAITTFTVDVSDTSGTCLASSGSLQCLRVQVSPGGQIRLCDPSHSGASDPLTC
jgi:type IV fimbrial biogenesis protein FimT